MSHLWCGLYGCWVDDVNEIVGEENTTCDGSCYECEDCSEIDENGKMNPVINQD